MARIGSRTKKNDVNEIESANMYNDNSECFFDIESVLKKHGIIVIHSNDMPCHISGRLSNFSNNWIIEVNNLHNLHRKRFSMAHEFAHYCLHRKKRNQFEDITFFKFEGQCESIEVQASCFASELLMPEYLIRREINKGVTAISNLSDIFGVSPLAIKFRLKNLGFIFKIE